MSSQGQCQDQGQGQSHFKVKVISRSKVIPRSSSSQGKDQGHPKVMVLPWSGLRSSTVMYTGASWTNCSSSCGNCCYRTEHCLLDSMNSVTLGRGYLKVKFVPRSGLQTSTIISTGASWTHRSSLCGNYCYRTEQCLFNSMNSVT